MTRTISVQTPIANSLRGNCWAAVAANIIAAIMEKIGMLNIALVGTFAASLEASLRRHVATPCEIIAVDEADTAALSGDTDVLVSMALTTEMTRRAPRLKLVQVPGAGIDRIDRAALPEGAALANVYGHETGIAEYVIGAMLTLSREFAAVDRALRHGDWLSQWAVGTAIPAPWRELAGKTLGLLGYGHIGREIARRARAFDMKIHAIRRDASRTPDAELDFCGGPDRLSDVLRQADFVVIAMPATAETLGSIGRPQLSLMKPTAFLINIARAQIVDERALYEALAQRAIAGAALDVWYRYPSGPGPTAPASLPFHDLSNVLMTPHVSGWTDGMIEARSRLIAENITRIAEGQPLLNLVV
jgi:phosphoglycerate dehydrogenase-like enzyme